MTTHGPEGGKTGWATKIAVGALFVVVVVGLMMWLAGVFHRKIDERAGGGVTARPAGGAATAEVRLIRAPHIESAVGTIRAVHETAVASKLLAKVTAVRVRAGQEVADGEVLVELDSTDLQARAQQAAAGVASATAARDQARIEFDRLQRLRKQDQATQIEFERADASLKGAEAELARAGQARSEAETIVEYATIRSPITGKVIDKRVEVGDTASPGQVLITLYDPSRMQLVARVRESLTQRLAIGQDINVHVDALNKTCVGRVSEIVPEAESASRTFSVKVTGPCPQGIYSGMFGRLLIPLDERAVLVVPQAAIRRIGQLDVVDVVDEAEQVRRRRIIQIGDSIGEDVQVLAGLREGEKVALSD